MQHSETTKLQRTQHIPMQSVDPTPNHTWPQHYGRQKHTQSPNRRNRPNLPRASSRQEPHLHPPQYTHTAHSRQPTHHTTKYTTRRLPAACLRSRVRSELATGEETVGSSPTSSRWALETTTIRTRLGYGRRLSGECCGGCGTIGEEIVHQPPQPVF